ncbi:hypothetical protein ACFSCX_23280 [Bacillus salitolerans]|uniref:Group-specific protein n=1 Tax=Bacillus salitolerans TaxID=1437434 RepID=A0ABW4LYW1_9BACI
MLKKVLWSIFIFHLLSTIATAQTNQQIEIFDINKGKVIKTVQLNSDLQQEVKNFLYEITSIYVKSNPIPNSGFMIRIPLEPNVMVKNRWFYDLVDEVIIIYSGQEEPYLMIYDDENKSYFFTFKGDTAKLLDLLNFKP